MREEFLFLQIIAKAKIGPAPGGRLMVLLWLWNVRRKKLSPFVSRRKGAHFLAGWYGEPGTSTGTDTCRPPRSRPALAHFR